MKERLRLAPGELLALALAGLVIWPFLHAAFGRVSSPYYIKQVTSPKEALWLHLTASTLALLIGLLNLLSSSLSRYGWWHRWLGRLYCAGVVLGIGGGMALLPQATHGGLVGQVGLAYGMLLWAFFTSAMAVSARQRRFEQHRRWALRSYAISFAGVTLRCLLDGGTALRWPPATVYAFSTCACFAVNLLLVEIFWVRRAANRVCAKLPQ